jgi:lipopolysaccharide/colanic/teichoic acid biosynthesis glycosyltransferase
MSNLNHPTHLVILRNRGNGAAGNHQGLLQFAVSSEPVAGAVLSGLSVNPLSGDKAGVVIAVPEEWKGISDAPAVKIKSCRTDKPICFDEMEKAEQDAWLIVSDGRFAVRMNDQVLRRVLADLPADVVMVNADPGLLAYREKVRFISEEKIACCHRHYFDTVEPTPLPPDWPHHLFIKANVLDVLLPNCTLPCSFAEFINRCSSDALKVRAIHIAGIALDLETEEGLLDLCRIHLDGLPARHSSGNGGCAPGADCKVSPSAKLVGNVLLGKNVQLGPKVVILGPTLICNHAVIGQGAVIHASIVGPDISVPQNQFLFNRAVQGRRPDWKNLAQYRNTSPDHVSFIALDRRLRANNEFQTWSRFSYARFFKRIADSIVSLMVLVLFTPLLPFVALAVKLSSPGPVFFKDKRQGLHGKAFSCLKLRTMIAGADKIQEKLRVVNQLDGPQFKIENDPRISTVGKFLRDTYIDEIPQFFNVLLGQMSVVGPRPSPESENTLCPSWRYARLSVRPGITGLWQVCRTREPMKDFQEWIYYDTKYVRNVSLKIDLWICWRTAVQMVKNFIKKF